MQLSILDFRFDFIERYGVFIGDVFEGVVAADCQRASAALIEGDAGIGKAAASKCFGAAAGKADRACSCDSKIGRARSIKG